MVAMPTIAPYHRLISWETGEQRFWVRDHAHRRTCQRLITENVAVGRTHLYTDGWQSYRANYPFHATVRYGAREWAWDDDGDRRCQVHCNACDRAAAALHADLRAFRGVHEQYLHLYVATYEAMVNTKHITPRLICRMCSVDLSGHTGNT